MESLLTLCDLFLPYFDIVWAFLLFLVLLRGLRGAVFGHVCGIFGIFGDTPRDFFGL